MWCGFAIRSSGVAAYLRGVRAAVRGRKRMKQKHHELMAKRTIDDEQLMMVMGMSERQVYEWQQLWPWKFVRDLHRTTQFSPM